MSAYGQAHAELRGNRGIQDGDRHKGTALMPSPIPDGFDLAFENLYRLAYRVAYRILGDQGDAEDVAQETLARAVVRWPRLKDRPEGWVTRVASKVGTSSPRQARSHSIGARTRDSGGSSIDPGLPIASSAL